MKSKKRFVSLLVAIGISLCCMVACSAGGIDSESMNSSSPGTSGKDYADEYDGKVEDDGFSINSVIAEENVEEKIIRTVEITAETKEFDRVTQELESMVSSYGGYVESSRGNGAGYNSGSRYSRNAYYVFRIPSEQLSEFLSRSTELCRVTSNYSNVSNVTATYFDMAARLETLRAEQTSLQAMLEKAEDIDTMLKVQQYLYDVIGEIESYETQLRVMDSKVAYSTVTLHLYEVLEYTETEEESWATRLGNAFHDSWVNFAESFQDFTVWLVNALPTLLVLGAIAAVIVAFILKMNHRHRPQKALSKDSKEEHVEKK